MKIVTAIKHPATALRNAFYYLTGNSIGRIFYPPHIYKSLWFNKISTEGWKWITTGLIHQKLLGTNAEAWWPVSPKQRVIKPGNISFHINDLNNFQMTGTYFQAFGRITIGRGTYIAQNVGIITANHNVLNPDEHTLPRDINIGEKCWIGMNSVILPGVTLGPHTTVGAGSIVTKSFPEGHCIIAGNPAKIIRYLEYPHQQQSATPQKPNQP